jgi:hypothetical protein
VGMESSMVGDMVGGWMLGGGLCLPVYEKYPVLNANVSLSHQLNSASVRYRRDLTGNSFNLCPADNVQYDGPKRLSSKKKKKSH